MTMLLTIKQHLSNIWSSIHEKVKQHWGWVEKKALLVKKACITTNIQGGVMWKKSSEFLQ